MFKSAAAKLAHNSTLPQLAGNYDLKPLQDLINAEKTVLTSLQRLSVDFARAGDALRTWGMGEGEDLGDTLSASTNLLNYFSNALSQYATHENTIREHMKSIRSREENLDELKRRRRAQVSKAEAAERKLSKMSPEHKNLHSQTDVLNRLRDEIRNMDSEIMSEEAGLGDFKRSSMRTLLGLKFGGLLECCEKGTVAGEFGKLVVMEIPDEVTQPGMARSMYVGHQRVYGILQDAQNCVSEIAFSTVPSEPRPPNPRAPGAPQLESDGQPSGGYYQNEPSYLSSQGQPDFSPSTTQQNYFSSPTMGRFMDAEDFSSLGGRSSAPASPVTNTHPPFPAPISTQPQAHPPAPAPAFSPSASGPSQSFAPEIQDARHERGFEIGAPQDPNSKPPSGGRFATFPVKPNSPGGTSYQLRDQPPTLRGNSAHEDDSFSSSIEAALNYSQPGRPSVDGPPSYSIHQGQFAGSPPRGGPPPQSGDLHSSPVASRGRTLTEHDNGSDGGSPVSGRHRGDDSEAKHVRFGEVSDMEDEAPKRPSQDVSRVTRDASPSKPSSKRVPPPIFTPDPDSEAEQKELDAAAAREISRELDALNFSAHGGRPIHDFSPTTPRGRIDSFDTSQSYSSGRGDTSPLAPPVAPFAHRGPSPRPDPTIQTSSPTVQSPPSQMQSPLRTAPSFTEEPSAIDYPPPSPISPRVPVPQSPSVVAPQARSNSSLRGVSPYSSDNLRASPLGTRSTSSLVGDKPDRSAGNSPAPPGTRTISAAAFRRGPARTDTGSISSIGGVGVPETTPLHLKKRLPASPYPQGGPRDRSDSQSRVSSGASQNRAPEHSRMSGGGEDTYDYLSAYTDSPAAPGTPTHTDFGSLGQVRIANEVDGPPPPGAGAAQPGGYGDGRFSTDLEGSLR